MRAGSLAKLCEAKKGEQPLTLTFNLNPNPNP